MNALKLFTIIFFLETTINYSYANQVFSNSDSLKKESDEANQSTLSGLNLAIFDIDVTPRAAGSDLAYGTVKNDWDLGLRAKGIVLLGSGLPIVLCSFDWIGISNEAYSIFKDELAKAAGTIPERIAVHSIHQHDTPKIGKVSKKPKKRNRRGVPLSDADFAREVLERLKTAIKDSIENAREITHVGLGEAEVFKVASSRFLFREDGSFWETRYTFCEDSAMRAAPEGTIDPKVSLISFWDGESPVAVLSYYATHPQSYYRTGIPNPDFPGIARFFRQLAVPDALHVHFAGAGGNVGAGKYNDGSHENRLLLAERLADGMKRAWDATERIPLFAKDIKWDIEPVVLPPSTKYMESVQSGKKPKSAWFERYLKKRPTDLACLSLGPARILHMPGELFVEYQLAAKAERKDLFVAMAAYGDLGVGYIPTAAAHAYEECYEISVAKVAPEAEDVLMTAIRKLLNE